MSKIKTKTTPTTKATVPSLSEFASSHYVFPGTNAIAPLSLRKWKVKFKAVGSRVYIKCLPTMDELISTYGAKTPNLKDRLSVPWVRLCTLKELKEWNAGKTRWDRTYEMELKKVQDRKLKSAALRIERARRELKAAGRSLALAESANKTQVVLYEAFMKKHVQRLRVLEERARTRTRDIEETAAHATAKALEAKKNIVSSAKATPVAKLTKGMALKTKPTASKTSPSRSKARLAAAALPARAWPSIPQAPSSLKTEVETSNPNPNPNPKPKPKPKATSSQTAIRSTPRAGVKASKTASVKAKNAPKPASKTTPAPAKKVAAPRPYEG